MDGDDAQREGREAGEEEMRRSKSTQSLPLNLIEERGSRAENMAQRGDRGGLDSEDSGSSE